MVSAHPASLLCFPYRSFFSSKMQATPKKKKPPDPALSVPITQSMICFPLCLSCAVSVGLHLLCSVLSCSALVIYSNLARSQWPIQVLPARSPPWVPFCFHPSCERTSLLSDITVASVFVDLLYQLEEDCSSELQPWRVLSLGLSSPEISVVCGDLARYGCRRASVSAIVQIDHSRGPRSGILESLAHEGLTRSVSIASICSFPRKAQVCNFIPLLFRIVLIDSIRTSFSIVLRFLWFDFSAYWNGLPRLSLLWRCLKLSWPIHVVACDVDTCWYSGWHVWVTKLCNLKLWDLVRSICGLVFTQSRFRRPTGNARLFLNLLMIESSALLCSPVWASFLLIRCLLLSIYLQSPCTQRVWPTWLVHLQLLVHARRSAHRLWTTVFLIQCSRIFLVVLTLVIFARITLSLPIMFVRPLDYPHLGSFMFVCNWYLCVALWVVWVCSLSYLLGLSFMSSTCPQLLLLTFVCSTLWILTLVDVFLFLILLSCQAKIVKALWYQGVRVLSDYANLAKHILLSLHLILVGQTPHRGWLQTCMMRLCSRPPTVRFVFFLYWGLPLFWLSLLQGRLIALKHELLCSCLCWQLYVFPMGGDEVKGKSPFVYEDMLSETSLDFVLDNLLDPYRIICMAVWQCGTSHQPSFSQHTRRATTRCEDYNGAFGATPSRVDLVTKIFSISFGIYCSFTLLFGFSLGMQCRGIIVVERMQCIHGNVVHFNNGGCNISYITCNDNLSRDSEQHLCVLGLCLMAPDEHLWMLEPAHHGFCLNRCFGKCPLALELHRRMLGLAHRGLGTNRSIDSSFTNRLCPLVRLRTLNCLMRLRLQGHRFIVTVGSK